MSSLSPQGNFSQAGRTKAAGGARDPGLIGQLQELSLLESVDGERGRQGIGVEGWGWERRLEVGS